VSEQRVLFDGSNHHEIAAFMGIVNYDPRSRGLPVDTQNGQVVALPGDVIVCDDGEWRVE
jgi:hypothetical protein